MKNFLLLLIFILPFLTSCKEQKIENLTTFAKAYGYVKYFHPSDEAFNIDWKKFSAYGAGEIEKCRTRKQLEVTLNDLFTPFAPSVRFTISDTKPTYDYKLITPDNMLEYKITYWQHRGVSFGMINNQYQTYKSIRVNRINQEKLFDYEPEFGEVITKEIGDGIYCQIPLVLYCNDQTTFPECDSVSLKDFKNKLKKFDYEKRQLLLRLGNVINAYNVFQHFYPYFDVVDVNWETELMKALKRSFTDKTPEDHLITLQKFVATLKDGHVFVNSNSIKSFSYSPPIAWEWIEDKLVITKTFEELPDIHIGDIVTEINGISPQNYFANIYTLVPAPTKGWRDYNANFVSLAGDKDTKMNLKVNNKTIQVVRKKNNYNRNEDNRPPYEVRSDNIWYLNMSKIEMDAINQLMPQLDSAKAIICDARGYPKGNHDFINHLMSIDDSTSAWMKIPQIVYPDHENVIGYENHNWIPMMKAKKPYLGNKKIIYIIDGRAISYAESCLGYIEGYKLAQIIGQPSAGTNGNVNPFGLLGGYTISWTGMKVLKHNGSQHHGIGIIPDILVSKTINGVKEGRDEFLEKAIEIAKN